MKLPAISNSGFTLIELMISVSLILIMTGALTPSFNNYTRNQSLLQGMEFLKNDLRSAQNKALTGVMSDALNARYWAVKYFDNGATIHHFISNDATVAACRALVVTSSQASSVMPSGINVKYSGSDVPNDSCIFFSFNNGGIVGTGAFAIAAAPSNLGRAYVGHASDTASSSWRQVWFRGQGLIYAN